MLIAAGWVASSPPASATCENARLISSVFPRGSESHIYTPGVQPGPPRSTVTDRLEGFFWALGSGHPVHRQGRDSGIFAALDREGNGWVHGYAPDPAAFHTTWAASSGIDGCIDDSTVSPRCTAVLLSDQDSGKGYFAVLTARADRGNYLFALPGRAPINLAAVPRPVPVGAPSSVTGGVQVAVRVDGPSQGSYLDSACPTGVIAGYKVYARKTPRGAAAPDDRERSAAQGWRLADGGESSGGLALALGTSATVHIDCTASEDVYLAASLVFDGGFETAHVSENSALIRCGQ